MLNIKSLKVFFAGILLVCAANLYAQSSAPIQVGGAFSSPQAAVPAAQSARINMEKEENDLRALLRNRQYRETVLKINGLTAAGAQNVRFSLYLAQAYEGLQDWENAAHYSTEVIASFPKDSRGYTLRANAYYNLKDYEAALIDIDRALKINPDSNPSKQIRARILAAGRPAAAPKPAESRPAHTPPVLGTRPGVDYNDGGHPAPLATLVVVCVVAFLFLVAGYWLYYTYRRSERPGSPVNRRKKIDVKEQYNFIRQIGEGGMGKVYEAYDNVLGRRVAVKRVRPELVRSDYVRQQFLSEARLVALLRHPNIVEIYTVIETDSSLYLVFEYVDGQTLETRLDIDGYIPFSEIKKIFENVCKALHYAHAQDIIHCDLKPSNIMIGEGGVAKVMDFGVAKKIQDGQTGARTVAGTPAYMAPEQQKGFIKKQSDVYSVGVCMYEALVGQVPWSVQGFDIAKKKIVPPHKLVPQVPAAVGNLLERAIKEDPKERIQSIDEFWSILSGIAPLGETPKSTHI